MAEEEKKDEAPKKPKSPLGPIVLAGVNTLAILITLGVIFYTQVLFKRPPITESKEREALEEMEKKKNKEVAAGEVGLIEFKPITVNIKQAIHKAKNPKNDSPMIRGSLRFVTIGLKVQIKNMELSPQIEAVRPFIMDQLITLLGHKNYEDLNNVHGRYILKNEIQDMINALVKTELVNKIYIEKFVIN